MADAALRAYGPDVLGVLIATLRDRSAAAEVYADFSANLWIGLPNFRWESSLRTWAYTLARNSARRYRRDPLRRRGVAVSDCAEVEQIPVRPRTETAPYRRTESKDQVSSLRRALDPDDQMLLVLRVDRKLPWDDIAVIMRPERPDTEGAAAPDDDAARRRAAASLRKRFERIKGELRALLAPRLPA
ncbi:MAG TPA: sigma-70 family RNA polymerase sigma factor [Polyangiaceae bacterium]